MKHIILALFIACGTTVATAQTTAPTPTKKVMKALGLNGKTPVSATTASWTVDNGTTIYASHPYANNIKGFRGPTPLYIAVSKEGKITAVAPDKNSETQTIWARVLGSKLFKAWNGKTLQSVATTKVDAVSGATYSSTAVIKTMQATAKKLSK